MYEAATKGFSALGWAAPDRLLPLAVIFCLLQAACSCTLLTAALCMVLTYVAVVCWEAYTLNASCAHHDAHIPASLKALLAPPPGYVRPRSSQPSEKLTHINIKYQSSPTSSSRCPLGLQGASPGSAGNEYSGSSGTGMDGSTTATPTHHHHSTSTCPFQDNDSDSSISRRGNNRYNDGGVIASDLARVGFSWCEYTRDAWFDFLMFRLMQTPVYIVSLCFCLLVEVPYALATYRTPNDSDIVGVVENSSVAMLMRPVPSSPGTYKVCMQGCRLVIHSQPFHSFSLTYVRGRGHGGHQTPCILECTINGHAVTDREQIMGAVAAVATLATHPKAHTFSNALVRRLRALEYTPLAASTYGTLPLHHGLLHGALSPINEHEPLGRALLTSTGAHGASVVDEAQNMATFSGHSALECELAAMDTPFTRFLCASRGVLRTAITTHGIDMRVAPFEALWNHTIVHAADHVCFADATAGLLFALHPWPITNVTGWAHAAMRASWIVFRRMYATPKHNPLWSFRISSVASRSPFWRDVYLGLANVDPRLAGQVTTSTMF